MLTSANKVNFGITYAPIGWGDNLTRDITNEMSGLTTTNSSTALQDMLGWGTDERNRQFNAAEAEKNRLFNSAEAVLERNWQEHMRDTNYTSAYKQMEEAGFNPILAFMEGQANAPAGANAVGQPANFQATSAGNLANNVSNLLGTYMLARNAKLTRQFWQAIKYIK